MSQFKGEYDGKVTPSTGSAEDAGFDIKDISTGKVEVVFLDPVKFGKTKNGRIRGNNISFTVDLPDRIRHYSGTIIPCQVVGKTTCIDGMFIDYPRTNLTASGSVAPDPIDDGGWTGGQPRA
jgi:hypothetical protein